MFEHINFIIFHNPDLLSLIKLLLAIKFWFYLCFALVIIYITYGRDRLARRDPGPRGDGYRFIP